MALRIEDYALIGNFPQAFSHVPLVNTAHNLSGLDGPARRRRDGPGAEGS